MRAASVPKQKAPVIVSRPVMTHVISSQPDAPTCRTMSADTMKMPEPIIDPATIIVESHSPSSRRKPVDVSAAAGGCCSVAAPAMRPRGVRCGSVRLGPFGVAVRLGPFGLVRSAWSVRLGPFGLVPYGVVPCRDRWPVRPAAAMLTAAAARRNDFAPSARARAAWRAPRNPRAAPSGGDTRGPRRYALRMVLRLGTVPYLNARPLVEGLPRDARVSLAQAVPSALAEQLRAGALDAALVSSVELFRAPPLRWVPGPAICSEGPVRSIRLFLRRPAERVRTLALDSSSLTAAVLAQLCLREFLGAGAPAVSSAAPGAPLASIDADAILRIGDPALATAPDGLQVLDLGEVWTAHTKLPFVYALWLVRPGVAEQPLTDGLLA